MTTQIFKTFIDFCNRKDKNVNGVSPEFAERHPEFAKDNETNAGCWCCWGCGFCIRCADCTDCTDCTLCATYFNNKKV